MGELVELIKASPEPLKFVGLALAYIVAFVILAERLHNLYSKTYSERRARRKEDLDALSCLVGNDAALKALCVESKHQEAFSRMTRLNVSKERRDLVLEILAMGFVNPKIVRLLEPQIIVKEDGKYVITIALSDLLMAATGVVGLCLTGIVMFAFNLAMGEHQDLARLLTLLIGSGTILFIAFLTRDPVQAIILARRTATRLEEQGLLEGKSGVWNQAKQGVIENKWFICFLMVVVTVVVIFGSLWAHSLKG